jgi:hypothetical protein
LLAHYRTLSAEEEGVGVLSFPIKGATGHILHLTDLFTELLQRPPHNHW